MKEVHPRLMPRTVTVGTIAMGGGHPVSVQTMLSTNRFKNREELQDKLRLLESLGCDILRTAVPSFADLDDLAVLTASTPMPVVADIHFDYSLALAAMDRGIKKVRINPGNIGASWKVTEVLKKARDLNIPLRIGINAGSLPAHLKGEKDKAAAMVRAAEEEIETLESCGFRDAVFSLKSSDIDTTFRANSIFSERFDYPLHLGITEAGPLIEGLVKSSIAFYRLLSKGVGDTIRVSLTDSEENEVIAGRAILISLGMAKGVSIISCPRCGRSTFDTHGFIKEYGRTLRESGKHAAIAVMGCMVNGPGEASSADLGITGSGKTIILFSHGTVLGRYSKEEGIGRFLEELKKL